jgi:hypothetical protein
MLYLLLTNTYLEKTIQSKNRLYTYDCLSIVIENFGGETNTKSLVFGIHFFL